MPFLQIIKITLPYSERLQEVEFGELQQKLYFNFYSVCTHLLMKYLKAKNKKIVAIYL